MPQGPIAEKLAIAAERCRTLDAPLAGRLQAFADELRALNPHFASVVDRLIARLEASHVGADAPAVGDLMPDFMLPDQSGRLASLEEFIEKGPIVIAFHRGHWCPYCRITADALSRIYDDVRALGGDLVVITPEIERFNAELRNAVSAGFKILSDIDNGYALMLSLAFYIGDESKELLDNAGLDRARFNAGDDATLPIPATFVVGRDGRIKARHIDPDFRKRMDIDEILAAVRQAAA